MSTQHATAGRPLEEDPSGEILLREDVQRRHDNAVTRFEQPVSLGDALYVLVSPDPREELR